MKSFTTLSLTVLGAMVLAGCATSYTSSPSRQVPERWNFAFDSREWRVGYQADNRQQAVREYVLPGQTVHNWRELVTSHYSVQQVAVSAMFEEMKLRLSRDCPSLRVSIIEESADNILYEWQHDGCQGYPPQHELRRITRSLNGTLMLSYVAKTPQLSAETRSTWISIIKAAKVRPDA